MVDWTDIQEEEGVSWITVSSYAVGKDSAEGHLSILPGDEVIPSKQTEVGFS